MNPMADVARVAHCFAPPLTDELLAHDKALADALPPSPIKDAMNALLACVLKWWELPESTSPGIPHESGSGFKVALHPDVAAALDDHIPWQHEIESYKTLFESVESDVCARNSEKIDEWYLGVAKRIIANHFPDDPTIYQSVSQLQRTFAGWSGLAD